MSFIEKGDPVVLNIKITSEGRELLAQGKLDFKYFALGDSEIDYNFTNVVMSGNTDYTPTNSLIFRPLDKNPKILSFIPKDLSGDTFNEIGNVPISPYIVHNQTQNIGFFNEDCTEFKTSPNHVKQPDLMVKVNGVHGGKKLRLRNAPTYGTSVESASVGDYLLVKWSSKFSTTGHTLNNKQPTPILMYKITKIYTSSLSSTYIDIDVDRELPNFNGTTADIYAGAMIYYNQITFSGDTIFNKSVTDYLSESVINFLENSQSPTIIFPYWNLSIIYTEEIVGVQSGDTKYTMFDNVNMGGFVSYIQNQTPTYKKLGVIHYTNQSPANVYAEGFYTKESMSIEIPTVMWHKSETPTLGVKLSAYGDIKMLTGETKSLNTKYYDLADPNGNVVGKVFIELKIFIIEDQELLFAMSYKSNRSWTLPNYNIDY